MNLLDQTPAFAEQSIEHWISEAGLPAYRARQILPRLWQRPAAGWTDCTDLPKKLLLDLEREFPITRPEQIGRQESQDGTVKYLWGFSDGAAVEAVMIPDGNRRTVCISSQVGCAFGCAFCATGKMGFQRQLTAWEITSQVRELFVNEQSDAKMNVVFMGMGEPLHNWSAVDTALSILNDRRGLGIGARRIAVSTVGIVPNLYKLAARPEQFRLALSLHSPHSQIRRRLMPVEQKFPLPDVLEALAAFPRRVTFEYVMIHGENDRPTDADELARIAAPIGAFVNLLQMHPGGAGEFSPTPRQGVRDFAARLRSLGINTTIRSSRGADIDAACGQLWVGAAGARQVSTEQNGHIQES